MPSNAASENATMFRADAAHTGVYASAPPTLHALKWRFATKGKVIGSPVVANGIVYAGSYDGKLYALRASDGSLLWSFQTKGPVTSTPAVAGAHPGSIVVFSSLDGNIYALDAATGKARWRYATGGERRFIAPGIHGMLPHGEPMPDPFDVFISSPAIAANTAYIGSGDRNVYALDLQTGKSRWVFKTGNVVHATPAVAGNTVFIGSFDRNFYALDAATGKVRWKYATGDDRQIYNQVGINASAAVAHGMVYFGARDSHFYALDARTGALRWKHDEHGSWVIGAPAIDGNTVYYTTSDERRFWALDATTGAEKFSVPYDAFSFSSPSVAGHYAYFGTYGGLLYSIDLANQKVDATYSTAGASANRAAHLDAKGALDIDSFYADNTFEGIVAGLDRIFALGGITGSPAIADGTAYFGSTDGGVYAVS